MKYIVLFFLLNVYCVHLLADTYWIHFRADVAHGEAEAFARQHHLIVSEQLALPLRYKIVDQTKISVAENDPKVLEINSSSHPLYTQELNSPWGLSTVKRDRYTLGLGVGSFAALTTYGLLAWDWGGKGLGFGSEGWFEKDTYAGGADKVGHATSLYFQKRALNWILLQMGHDFDHANLYSALMAESLGIALEIGDGLSKYLFSFEDLAVDTAGILFAYLLDRYPALDALMGIQLMYWPSQKYLDSRNPDKGDISSDYDGMDFLLNIKATGIPILNQHKYLRYGMLNLGYRTRGYLPDFTPETQTDNNRRRELTVSLSINLSELVFGLNPESKIFRGSATLLKYWTPRGSAVEIAKKRFE